MKKLLFILLLITSMASAQSITAPTFLNASTANGSCVLGIGGYTFSGNIFYFAININGIDYSDGNSGFSLWYTSYNGITVPKCWFVENGLPDLVAGSTYTILLKGFTNPEPPYTLVATSPSVNYTVPATYNCTQNCPKKKKKK